MENLIKKINDFLSDESPKMRKSDYILVTILIIIYSIISFINLGSTTNPQTFSEINSENPAIFEIRNARKHFNAKIFCR